MFAQSQTVTETAPLMGARVRARVAARRPSTNGRTRCVLRGAGPAGRARSAARCAQTTCYSVAVNQTEQQQLLQRQRRSCSPAASISGHRQDRARPPRALFSGRTRELFDGSDAGAVFSLVSAISQILYHTGNVRKQAE